MPVKYEVYIRGKSAIKFKVKTVANPEIIKAKNQRSEGDFFFSAGNSVWKKFLKNNSNCNNRINNVSIGNSTKMMEIIRNGLSAGITTC